VGKRIDAAWVAGGTPVAPTGGLSSSLTLANDTWYAVIAGKVSGTEEVGFDTSAVGANLVTDHSFTSVRRIGWVRRETATNRLFKQLGDKFLYVDAKSYRDFSSGTYATTSTALALSVPNGEKLEAIINASVVNSLTNTYVYIRSPDVADVSPDSVFHNLGANDVNGNAIVGLEMRVRTDTSGQIFHRSSTSISGNIYTLGYFDRRGKDG
jgi:hypothetical protein